MKKELRELKIGNVGVLDINVPVIKVGSGNKRVLLIIGVHGDELSGLLVANNLLENWCLAGVELDIITAANPLAQALGVRQALPDLKDLNRVFPGDASDSITSRGAAALFKFAKKFDLVIDLHTFSNLAPITAIFMNSGTEKIRAECIKLIRVFNPEIVWQLTPLRVEESHFTGALGPRLANAGVPNFGVEMPEHFRISNNQIERIVTGIISTTKAVNGNNVKGSNNVTLVFDRQVFKSNRAGIFLPTRKLLDEVKEGEEVGEIISIKNLNKNSVKSPFSGTLIEIADKSLANLGDTLFTVGKRVA